MRMDRSHAHLHGHADLAGAAASTLCLIHCLLTPVAIGFFPAVFAYLPGDTTFHRLLAAILVLVGAVSFIPGYRLHRRKPILAMIATGIPLILIVAWKGDSLGWEELVFSVAGSLLLVAAHLLNRSFCHQCLACIQVGEACRTTTLP